MYIDKNYFTGWGSDACVGQVDSNGYVYNDVNYISGWGSGSCIGRVDKESGFVYKDTNTFSGWASSSCVGCFDEDGYIYNDKNTFSGFSSGACVGQMDSGGYVYTASNYLSGWASGVCVGEADGIGEAAALLLLILPRLKQDEKNISNGNIKGGGGISPGGGTSGSTNRGEPSSGSAERGSGNTSGGNTMNELAIFGVIIGIFAVYKIVTSIFRMIRDFVKAFPGNYIVFTELAAVLLILFILKRRDKRSKNARINRVLNKQEKLKAFIWGFVSAFVVFLIDVFFGKYKISFVLSRMGMEGLMMYASSVLTAWCMGAALRAIILRNFHK